MWNPLRKKPLLSEEDSRFQIDCFRWLLTHFGGDRFYKEARLVLPTDEFFPSVVDSRQSAAETTFEQVKKYAGMQQWPTRLKAQEEDPNPHLAPTLIVQNTKRSPLGTFSVGKKNRAVITYNPKIVADPVQMVATFSHELAHYLTGTAPESPPGGWKNWEFATDIAATFLGFGIFQANAAFNFRQYSEGGIIGWQTTGGGYLSEAEHSYALAIFLRLKDIPADRAIPYCDTNIREYLKRALDDLDRGHAIQGLKSVARAPL